MLNVHSSSQLVCEYQPVNSDLGFEYICAGNITTTRTDYLIDGVSGTHASGKGNDDVTSVVFIDMSMEVTPRNLNTFFKNFKSLSIVSIDKLPNFKRSDFYDFTELTYFCATFIDSVTQLPRDTFFDTAKLKYLLLDMLPNMENFNVDLLMNLRQLAVFSAKGPNKINQISPGFFRNQIETLTAVDFSGTNLVRIGYSVFVNIRALAVGRFYDSGCLNERYSQQANLTAAIRAKCQDVIIQENGITKKLALSSSDSSE